MTAWSSTLAGTWYPAQAEALRTQLRARLDDERPTGLRGIRALLVPHAGYEYSGATAAAAYREVEGCVFDRAVIIGPSHRLALHDALIAPRADAFETPLGALPTDRAALEGLLDADGFGEARRSDFLAEHSVQIQFPFLQETLPGVPVVPLVCGRLSAGAIETLARGLRPVLAGNTLLIISSDFTHFGPSFGYVPFKTDIEANLRRLDLGAFDCILRHDSAGFRAYLARTGATNSGADPITLMLALLHPEQTVHRLAYTTSGHGTGDWSHVVSYLAAAVTGTWEEGVTPP